MLKITRLYNTKRRFGSLRATINGRAYRCGQTIRGTPYHIVYISTDGELRVRHEGVLTVDSDISYTGIKFVHRFADRELDGGCRP